MKTTPLEIQVPPPEAVHATELTFLSAFDEGERPPRWRLTPRAVVTFIMGSSGDTLKLQKSATVPENVPRALVISQKFVGDRSLVERAVVTLAGERGLLLVGEPGTAKSMLSELLAAAVSNDSSLTVQGTAGTAEEHLRYGWNYSLLLAKGPCPEALVPSPVLTAMKRGSLARVEEVTRCLPEVQDALVSILSDRRMAIPELTEEPVYHAHAGFNVIATANLRDRGVSEMSAALKRRFNFETVPPIADFAQERGLVERQAEARLARVGQPLNVDASVLEVLVTVFRDLRHGQSSEGWVVEKPSTVMSTAEAVAVASALGMQSAYFGAEKELLKRVPQYLLGVVLKDEPKDRGRLLAYWDSVVRRRAESNASYKVLLDERRVLEEA
jgi:MoxR-like ATPase